MKKAVQIFTLSAFLLTFMLTKTINAMQDTEEIWKPISGYTGHEVSNLGRVRSIDQYVPIHHNSKRFHKGKIRVLDPNKDGYLMVRMKSKGKYHTVHRLVCDTFIDNLNNWPLINHKNGIKTDNRVENLEWCTHSYNNKHSFDIGLRSKYWGANKGRK